jgi:hypothetical protein
MKPVNLATQHAWRCQATGMGLLWFGVRVP